MFYRGDSLKTNKAMAFIRLEWGVYRFMALVLLACCITLQLVIWFVIESVNVNNEGSLSTDNANKGVVSDDYFEQVVSFFWEPYRLGYTHVWPNLKFGWKIIVGSIIAFFGAASGSVGGVGGGGIYVPMLQLIIGFDAKSSTAMSKCMIMGASAATVFCNLKMRHPTLDMPMIDYDLALLVQPMLVLGISIGVAFNVMFADWMITVLLIILFLGTSTKAFFKGVETWKKETIIKMEANRLLESNGSGSEEAEYNALPGTPSNAPNIEKKTEVPILENVYWKKLGLLLAVWITILALEICKNNTTTCSMAYWAFNLLQIPVAVGVSSYEAISIYKDRRVTASKGEDGTNFKVHQLILYCVYSVVAGIVGGLLGIGGGSILGPMFLELGVHPQASSATATFAMAFSSSMSVVEYYLLKRFPVSYALYFVVVAAIAAFVAQHVVRKVISILGRASLIIFVLSFSIFISAISLGGVGISNIVKAIDRHEYMGFENICTY